MKQELLILQGCPASGKSTWAKNFIKGKSNYVRICRDDIREMCGDYWVPDRESLISKYEIYMIKEALKSGYNVIIDATNLNPKTFAKWNQIGKEFNCTVSVKEFTVSFIEAIRRDASRERSVGESVIRTFYEKYYPSLLPENL